MRSSAVKLAITLYYQLLMIYTMEVFPTKSRSKAFTLCFFVGKFLTPGMPLILEYLNARQLNPHFIIGLFLGVGLVLTLWMKEISYSNVSNEIVEALRMR